MESTGIAERKVLKKIQKRRQKVIKTYEKLIKKLEGHLEKVNRLEEEEEVVSTVRLTISTGLNQSRKFLEKIQDDYQKAVFKQIKI
ncbi:hypothetical protein [Spirosoma flavum]|uniref:Uncharacterized protein n=1 Tax=Spirosoma flavum TaxID=2048557 RepID=A0ABW6AS13_9BACT